MHKVELNDKEVRQVGERRWVRKHWKRLLWVAGGWFAVYICMVSALIYYDIQWKDYCVFSYLIVGVLLFLKIWDRGRIKAGKQFLKKTQEVKNGLF